MSVIGEVVGIVACVAAVISAYHDGGAIIQRIKLKRASDRAPAPPRLLEESIDQAPTAIEQEKQRGIARFGKAFEDGDHIAVIALQRITIQLQGSLLEKLRRDDEGTDFMFLVDAADVGRDRTIGSLLELRQRLLAKGPIHELLDAPAAAAAVGPEERRRELPTTTTKVRDVTIHSAHSPEPDKGQQGKPTWTRSVGAEEDATAGPLEEPHTHEHGRKRHSSLLSFFKHHRSHSNSAEQSPSPRIEEIHESTRPSAKAVTSPPPAAVPTTGPTAAVRVRSSESTARPGPQPSPPQRSFQYQDWEDDPAQIWGAPKPAERRDTVASLAIPPDATIPTLPTSPAESARTLSIARIPSVGRSSSIATATTAQITTPNPDNAYLGFCKSAYKLQNGDRKTALTRVKEFNDGWSQATVYYLCCSSSKCAFAGHINLDVIWTKVWTVEARGLKFRWPFLAKSHVPQQKVKGQQYGYQCLFCAFQGEKTAVYFGTDTYLEHVSGHRGQGMSEVVLYMTKAVTDRILEVDEHESTEFDINLFPLNDVEAMDRRVSEVLSDDLLAFNEATREAEEQSRVASNEPWNEGLSDFHWGGEMERVELE
ncbi:hypothetical protein LTR62_008125 [Meristemomyces frigidus]|uniref:Uncharacterized protein n=1 Tax=Meristemomyces frigidus TaxID=1508187 RepID=A0AAN7TBG5_9PEZI|nr:hypothetical protein LTR62_008125 [Meristemomyces frigidus]